MVVKRWMIALALGAACVAQAGFDSAAVLKSRVLPPFMKHAAWDAFFIEIDEADAAADKAWRDLKSVEAYDRHRQELRRRMTTLIGGFPQRTPLNARVTGTVPCDGFRIERVLFESRPGAFVTALLHLPDASRFAAPYPAALFVCGHSDDGKNSAMYRYACMQAAKAGIAVLAVDPLGQGERVQVERGDRSVAAHLRMGVNAMLLGHNFAAFEIWDMMRALDYLEMRPDIAKVGGGYGCFGNSGGGTQTALIAALDDRIVAAAPCCYLSNLREQNLWRLMPDCEQLLFDQVRSGVNQAGFVLMGGHPVRMHGRRDDICPYSGTRETYRVVHETAANLGRADWYGLMDAPGPHGYCASTVAASVQWLRRWLRDDRSRMPDADALIRLDETFDVKAVDFGPTNVQVVADGKVSGLPGFKSVYDYLDEELEEVKAARPVLSAGAKAEMVVRLADIHEERCTDVRTISTDEVEGVKVTKMSLGVKGGYAIPAIEFTPPEAKAEPVMVVGDSDRTEHVARVNGLVAAGHPVLVVETVGAGEGGVAKHTYYHEHPDEELGKMLYVLGSSLVGRRAEQLVAFGIWFKIKYARPVRLIAAGRTAVAAAHAKAASPKTFAEVELVRPPPSWEQALRQREFALYATSVHGALFHYDWTDLLK